LDANKVKENQILRLKEAEAWATAVPSIKNGTVLSKEEWDDNFRYRYGIQPLNLPTHCDGCGERFSTERGLNCKHGGLVNERHDDVTSKWEHLAMLAWQPGAVSYKPIVHDGNMPHGNNNNNT